MLRGQGNIFLSVLIWVALGQEFSTSYMPQTLWVPLPRAHSPFEFAGRLVITSTNPLDKELDNLSLKGMESKEFKLTGHISITATQLYHYRMKAS